ncbi:MAG: hypothetical protein K2J65_04255 [Duncaniella sp.]|nr:hypothetical protein [Duncaniella sp.]
MIVPENLLIGFSGASLKEIMECCVKRILMPALLMLIVSCADNKPKPPERLPEEEVPAYREAVIKMSKYIVLEEDSVYHFTLSKDKAVALGIPEKYYDRMWQDLEYTNYIVREEYNEKGIPIEMAEYKIDTTQMDTADCTSGF